MKIAQVAAGPLPVPPDKYGGMERIISYLTERLVRRGHTVTLFAKSDSKTRARLISPPTYPQSESSFSVLDEAVMMSQLSKRAGEFDVIHVHPMNIMYWLAFLRPLNVPYLITHHNAIPEVKQVELAIREFSDVPLVSLSHAQRDAVPWMNWQTTVYLGLPLELYTLQEKSEGYLAFIGRLAPFKGLHDAIEIARQSKMKLKIAGRACNAEERQYFEGTIKPLLTNPMFEYVGELDDTAKQSFLGGASALLFPVMVREAFGLAMIEALACGTPVIGYRRGSVPEVITDGVTGFVVTGVQEAVQAVRKIPLLSRTRCRQEFEKRFCVDRMCTEYEDTYETLLAGWKSAC